MRVTGWTRGLITLGFGGVLIAGSVMALLLSQDAVAETQQTGTPLSNPTTSTTQANQATKITPEQEAALVEVRKILIEAREVAEGIQLPSPLLTKQATIRALEEAKKKLLWGIEEAQLRAGDLSIQPAPGSIHFNHYLALARARYGETKEVVESAARAKIQENDLLLVIDDVIKAGDIPAAFKVVDATMTKEVAHAQRFRSRAAALALIAQRQ